jgi:hypothetical protein
VYSHGPQQRSMWRPLDTFLDTIAFHVTDTPQLSFSDRRTDSVKVRWRL